MKDDCLHDVGYGILLHVMGITNGLHMLGNDCLHNVDIFLHVRGITNGLHMLENDR